MQGTIAEAKDLGDSTVVLTGANTIKGGESLAIEAKSAPRAEAEARSYAGSLLGAGASVANASASGRTSVTAADGSSFAGKKVNISAYLDQQPDGKSFHDNVSALAVGVSGNIGGFSGNLADARETSDIGVSIGESTYDTDSLIISGSNQARIHGDSTGVNAGIATGGLNDTTVKGTLTTSVTASGMKSGSRLGTVSIEGSAKGILDGSADGTGAGIANISPVAAKLTTWLTQNTDTNVKGNWSADAFSAKSANKEDANLSVNSLGAAVVNASGSEMTTNISHTAKTNVTGSIETDGRQSYYADNTADEEVNLRGSGYGGLSRTANEMDNTLSYTAGVNLDKAALSANGAKGSIDVLAMTEGEMNYLNQTKSAGVGPSTNSTTTSHVTYDNSITAKDSTLKTAKENQNITMASVDVTKAAFKTVADTQGGIAGAASGSTDSTLDRSNKISISGGLIESMNDVNLYAGASLNRYESSLNYELSAEVYNRTVIPLWTDPKVTNSMTQKNQLLIDGNVRSVRHTNLYAEKGVTTVTETAREYKLYTKDGGEGEVASTAHGDRIKNEVEDNYIDLGANGSILAGIHTDLDLAISGGTSYTDNGAGIAPTLHTDGVEVTVSKGADWFDKDSVEIGTVTLTNPFYERYMNLLRQMGEYPVESNEHKNLKAGAEMLAAMMESGGYTRNGRILGEVEIASASIPDIIISGGNINIDADKVQGTGSLTARSANSATISNASDLYMKTGKIVLKESGGEIRRDGVSVKSKDELAGFTGTMESSSLIDIAPSVTIQSTGVGKDVSMTDDKGVSHTVRITRPDIGVFGNIENARGKITIRNNNENVYVDSKANVTGKTIEISAEKGAVTQATSGWNVVGSDPILRYRFSEDIAKKIQTYLNDNAEAIAKGTKDVSWLTKASTYEEFLDTLLNGYHWEGALSTIHISNANALKLTTEELDEIRKAKSDYEADDGAGVHAGENVYLTAKNVIIDGLTQSGYNKYETVLDSTESLNRTSAIKSLWQGNGSPELTNDRVLGDKEYLVNEGGGAHYNTETKVWEYAPRIYYNPSTNNYVTENIEPVGGKIYIAGNVASTNGKGRILAMDGKGDIHIDTTAAGEGSTLVLNTIKNQDVDGLISIRDPAANMRTEIRMGDNGITYDYTPIDGDADSAERIAANGDGSLTYNPMNQRLIWTGGSSGGTTHETKQYKEDFVFWGGITYNTTDEFVAKADETGNVISIGSVKVDGNPAESGQVIINASEPQTNDYEVTTSYYQGAKHIGPEVVERHYKSKFFGIGTRTHTWEESYETAKSSTYSINANKPITIDFLKSGNGSISVASAGNIKLEGNVSSASSTGTVSLSSTKGSIEGGTHGVITTDHLTARGESDVFLGHAAAGTDATIDITSASGDISILSDQGNLHIDNASALNGTVNIHADDSIQTNEGKKIEGQRIDLTSDHGSITALANAASEADDYNSLWANLNAQADGDITLRNDNGNMRIGRIVSKSGDVVLTTSGSFEEAANNVDISSSEDKLKQWKELGLINAGDAAGSREKSAEAAKTERQAILDARGAQLAQASAHTAEEYKAAASAYAKAFAESTDMQEAQDTYEKIVKANPDNELALQNAYEDYTNKKKAFLAELGYTGYTDEEENLIFDSAELISSTSYGWSQNDLLYAIQDSILNASPRNEVVTAEEANIEGRNITLRAAENIGTDDAPVEMSYDSLSNEDNLQILSKAKAGDLTWDDEKNILTVRQQRPITIKASGTVDISANPDGTSSTGNIYLAGVKNTQLNISGNIDTNADVKLMSDNGVQMESGTITARNLIITGGNGDIGSEEKNILTNISGSLDARTEKNLYLHQMALGGNEARVLTLQNAGASGVYLTSDAGIAMTTETGKTMGYIDGDRIYLTSKDGAIGKEGDGIRIRNNGALLSAHAETDGQGIYLSGKESKSLILSEVTAGGDFKIESEGTVDAGVLADEEAGTSAVSSAITADNVSFKTLGAVHLVNGTIETAETGDTSLEASGEITQTTSNTIQSGSLTVKASGGVDMQTNKSGTANKFGTINLTALAADKDVLIENAHDTETTVNIAEGTTTNSITVTNNSTSDSSNVIIHGEGTAETYIKIDNGKGTIKTDSNLTANGGNITLTAKDGITNEGAIAAKEGVSMASDSGIITNKGAVSASAGSVSMTTTGAIINKGTVTAQAPAKQSKMKRFFFSANDISNEEVPAPVESTIDLTAGEGITQEGTLHASGDVHVYSSTGDIKLTGLDGTAAIISGDDAYVEAKDGSITVTGDVTAANNASLISADGKISLAGNMEGTAGNVVIRGYDESPDEEIKGDIEVKGNVTAGGLLDISTVNGKIMIGTETGKTELSAGTGASIQTTLGDIEMNGNILTGGDTSIYTAQGSIGYEGNLETTKGNLTIEAHDQALDADAGNIDIIGNVTGAGAASLTAENGGVEISGNLLAKNGLAGIAASGSKDDEQYGDILVYGDVTSDTGDISIGTNYGSLIIGEDEAPVSISAAKTANISNGEGTVAIYGNVSSANGTTIQTTTKGSIDVTGTLETTGEGDVEVLAKEGDINLAGKDGNPAVTSGHDAYVGTDAGGVTVTGDVTAANTASLISTGGKISLTGNMEGTAGNAVIHASDAASEDVKGDIEVKGNVTSGGLLHISTDNGKIVIGTETEKSELASGNTAVIRTETGDINIYGSAGAASDMDIEAAKAGNVLVEGNLSSEDKTVKVFTKAGEVTLTGDLEAGDDIDLETDQGSMNLTGSATAGGNILAGTHEGDIIQTGGSLKAGDNIAMGTRNGAMDIGGALSSGNGNVDLMTVNETGNVDKGNIIVRSTAAATNGYVSGYTTSGNVDFLGDVTADKEVLATTESGNVHYAGNIKSGADILLNTGEGDITLDGKADAAGQTEIKAAKQGTITLRDDLTSGTSISLGTNEGNIFFKGLDDDASEDINITSKDGNVEITTTGTGDIKDGWLEDNGDHAVIRSEGGNLTISHSGSGEVDLYSLYALEKAGADVKDGDIVIDTVDGDVVAVITRNPDKVMEATHITAGSRLDTSGTHIDIGSVAQREGYTTPLEFASIAADDTAPIENFVIGDLKGGTELVFDHLWMKNGYISVSGGTIEIDKLYVEDRAYFSNGTMSTQVFGTTPIAGKDISTTYWNNTSLNRPGTDLETWLSDGNPGRWMYLYFDGGANTQLSNGNLVEVKPYNHVYSQRYSMAEEMARETGKDGMTMRITRYNPGRAKFDHEGLVDASQLTTAIEDKTEKEAEIKVEG